jgi:hypothetical protein
MIETSSCYSVAKEYREPFIVVVVVALSVCNLILE